MIDIGIGNIGLFGLSCR